jgi:hypothetical protein
MPFDIDMLRNVPILQRVSPPISGMDAPDNDPAPKKAYRTRFDEDMLRTVPIDRAAFVRAESLGLFAPKSKPAAQPAPPPEPPPKSLLPDTVSVGYLTKLNQDVPKRMPPGTLTGAGPQSPVPDPAQAQRDRDGQADADAKKKNAIAQVQNSGQTFRVVALSSVSGPPAPAGPSGAPGDPYSSSNELEESQTDGILKIETECK